MTPEERVRMALAEVGYPDVEIRRNGTCLRAPSGFPDDVFWRAVAISVRHPIPCWPCWRAKHRTLPSECPHDYRSEPWPEVVW